jgi:hypothetical protein
VWLSANGAHPGASCFVTQAGNTPQFHGANAALRDLETGAVRSQFDSTAVLLPTPDGCSATSNLSVSAQVALDGTSHALPGYSGVQAVSPKLDEVIASGRPQGGQSGWAAVPVAGGVPTSVPVGIYTWVPDNGSD